jgi:hypothetical protein
MTDETERSLEQRRRALRDELAAQRALVVQRLAAQRVGAAAESDAPSMPGLSAAYPRSMTLRLAQRHPALAVGLVALGAALLIRGRRDELDGILSMAKAVEPLFSGLDPAD